MRTAIIILGGFILWAICLGIGKSISDASTPSMTIATAAFIALWFIVAVANMWVGISKAGYSFEEELPVFLLIFLLPTAVAVLVKWKFL